MEIRIKFFSAAALADGEMIDHDREVIQHNVSQEHFFTATDSNVIVWQSIRFDEKTRLPIYTQRIAIQYDTDGLEWIEFREFKATPIEDIGIPSIPS